MGSRGTMIYVLLGLAVACFSLYAITLHPATLRQVQLQVPTPLAILAVLAGVVYLAIRRCLRHGSHHQLVVTVYVAVIVCFGLLCLAGLVGTFFVIAGALRGHV